MKYKVLKKQPQWEQGDIVQMNENAAREALKIGAVELYEGNEPAKHAWVLVDPVEMFPLTEKI